MTDKEVMQQALEALEGVYLSLQLPDLLKVVGPITALREALAQPEQEPTCPECKVAVLYECVACSSNNYPPKPQPEPVAWAVQGCSKMWRDEFAEIDAKAEAKRIGGTCVAYALYTTPLAAPVQDVNWKDMYEKEKRRSEMWVAKYEKDIGPLEYAVPVAAPVQSGLDADCIASVVSQRYTTPPAAHRKPLTDEEIGKAWAVADGEHNASASVKRRITRAIEAAHGIKERNT